MKPKSKTYWQKNWKFFCGFPLMTVIFVIVILVLTAGVVDAQYLPSGSRSSYNADVDSTRMATGGPVQNYNDNGVWRKITSNFRLFNGHLVSDSGVFSVSANLSNNFVRFDWKGHILKVKVGALYAYRKSTDNRLKVADPNFSNRFCEDNIITLIDIYPNVDLKITNTSDNLEYQYIFHQAARNSFDTWWTNNGSLDDIYLLNTLQLGIDSLGLTWNDDVGSFDCSTDRDITGKVKLKYGNVAKFLMPVSRIELDAPPGNDTTLYKRIMIIGGNPYVCEGFKWVAVREWADGDLFHAATFGSDGSRDGSRVPSSDGIFIGRWQMGASTGTLDSIYIILHSNWNNTDTVIAIIYDDNSDDPNNLVGRSVDSALLTVADYVPIKFEMSGEEVTANAWYWIGPHTRVDGEDTRIGTDYTDVDRCALGNDALPVDDPFVGDNHNLDRPTAWAVYTVGGEPPAAAPTRRRRILQGMSIEYPETVDSSLMVSAGFEFYDNLVAESDYRMYDEFDNFIDIGFIYVNLPIKWYDVDRNYAVNILDMTRWIQFVYKGY